MSVVEDRLRRLLKAAPTSPDGLFDLLVDGLDWPIPDGLSLSDIQLEWEPEELHLDPEKVAKLTQISQIPPLTKHQKFGVFVLNFEGGRLPVGAIRRLVQRLVKNERARKGSGTHAQWSLDDLLFFCLSEGQERLLHIVNFRENDGKRVLRVLSWSDQLTSARLDLLIRRGVPDLAWSPSDGPKIVLGHEFGRGFHAYREGIKSAAALSRRMADVAQEVRDEVRALYEVETEDGPIRALFNDVRDQLLGDLTPARFADVYAQTMVYGLLTARIAHPEAFTVEQSVSVLKFDNEFLDAIYSRFRDDSDGIIDVDELGLNELAEELATTDVDELLADFGADNQRDDPVVYFYEEFLAQYDPDQRRDLGAFYTPLPVVRYIVKTVDDALRSFDLPLGVADLTTWAEYIKAHPGIEIPKRAKPDDPVVSMFDPANGTGTFLVEWIRQARRNAGVVGEEAALAHASACEISLASYTVSHLKVSLDISEKLREKSRLPIYLGDTLGQKHPYVIDELADPISTEGAHADEVKFDWNHNVLIGNPPYDRVESSGTGGFVTAPQDGSSRSLFDDIFDDARKHTIFSHHASLYNLYVYFWRWAIWKAFEVNTGPAVVSMITASSWLTGPGFIGLRRLAREVADEIIVLDLGGDNKGSRKDENVFDIESPVAIVTLIRKGHGDRTRQADVRYMRVWGTRSEKLETVVGLAIDGRESEFVSAPGDWHDRLVPDTGGADWSTYAPLVDLFPWQSPGCKFNRTWPIAPMSELLATRWDRLLSGEDEADRAQCFVTPSSGRNIWSRVGDLKKIVDLPSGTAIPTVARYGYRSFDRQHCIADPRVAALERPPLWASVSEDQVFLTTLTTKVLGGGPATVPSAHVPDLDYFSGRGGKDVIPLYRDAKGTPNADPKLLDFVTKRHRESDASAAQMTIERLFAYAFGVLAGTDYTARFEVALATPGPRVPLAADPDLFARVASHGERLLWLQTFGERFAGGQGGLPLSGITWSPEPTKLPADKKDIKYDPSSGTLTVANGTLIGVPHDVWGFEVSGMQVIPKWLGYRLAKPAGKAASSKSPLDKMRPKTWLPEWSLELIEIVGVLKETLSMVPSGVALLDEIVAGPLIGADELPPISDALRKPPTTRRSSSDELALSFEEAE